MRIDLQCEVPSGLRDYIATRMRQSFGHFRDRIQWARIKVADVKDPEGSDDKRCVVQLRLRNRPDVVFAVTAAGARAAVDRAAERVAQMLVRRLGRRPRGESVAGLLPAGT